jgi:membrane-associated phospholipid phosphatase
MIPRPGQVSLAIGLLAILVSVLTLAWRWFEANRDELVARMVTAWRHALTAPALERTKARYPRVWTFVAARFARGEYLGLHLTVGFIVTLVGLSLFASLTEDVIHNDPLTVFDVRLLTWTQAHATPTGTRIFTAISSLGSLPVMSVLALGVALLLVLRHRWIALAGWSAAIAGGGLLDGILKIAIQRPRPPTAAALLQHSWSFPSGHAMGSLIGYGMLAYLLVTLWVHARRAQVAIVAAAALLVVAIGVSRLYLGVHYFSDVAGGYAAGMLWLSACASGLEVAHRMGATSPIRS